MGLQKKKAVRYGCEIRCERYENERFVGVERDSLILAYQLEAGSICIAWLFCQTINLTHILRSRSSLHPPRHVWSTCMVSLKYFKTKKKHLFISFLLRFVTLSASIHSPLDVSAKRPFYPSPPLSVNKNLSALRASPFIFFDHCKLFFFYITDYIHGTL